jgi:hypothetical protein
MTNCWSEMSQTESDDPAREDIIQGNTVNQMLSLENSSSVNQLEGL